MIGYVFFRIIVFIFRILPFSIIYLISDFFAFFMSNVFFYRKKVILENLKNSFPEKSLKEINKIKSKFYHHLTDIMLESIKGYTLSEKKLRKRYTYANKELSNKFYEQNKNIIFAGGHYGNWEWGSRSTPIELDHKIIAQYKPLANKYIEKYLHKLRTKNNAELLSIYKIGKDQLFNNSKNYILIMVGDQNPSNVEKAIWVNFLNQPTACLHGIEIYSKKLNMPVVYFSISKIKRGYYSLTMNTLTENPQNEAKGEITKKFMQALEYDIKNKPEYWLWSHKRWKHKFDKTKYHLFE